MMGEFYARLFGYAPTIMLEAIKATKEYDRFRLTIKLAFSIMHSFTQTCQIDIRPVMPKIGETLQGQYPTMPGLPHTNILMETDFHQHLIADLLLPGTFKQEIRKSKETTYIHIESNKGRFQLFGNLTYHQSQLDNHVLVSLPGTLTVKYQNDDGTFQTIKMQLPDYVCTN